MKHLRFGLVAGGILIGLLLLTSAVCTHAAVPAVISLTPAPCALTVATRYTFTARYSDADGAANMAGVFLMINTAVSSANGVDIYYDINSNKLYLKNDAGTAWLGGYPKGSAQIIENSYCKLYAQQTTAVLSGANYTVNFSLEFKGAMAGKKYGAWMFAADDEAHNTGWRRISTYLIGYPPSNSSLLPASANLPLGWNTFVATYSDQDGSNTLTSCYLLLNKTLSGASAAYVQYDRQANKLYLRNDANTAWLGPLTPGAGTLENSFCKLDGVLTTISSTQNTVKINWRLFLKNAVLGKTLGGWMYVADQFGMTAGWDKRATYPIGSTPVNVSATPTSGSFETGQKTTLTTKYSDADGVANIADAYLLVNDIAVSDGLYLLYSSTANKLFIRSTNDTQWLPAGGVTPGSGAAVSSDYGTLYPSETTVTKSGNELIVNWRVSFGSGLGDKTVKHWLYVQDAGGSTDGWDGFGSLSITLPVEVSDIVLVPESIVLGENDSYTLRAAILDEFGQVASRAVTPTWSTDAAGTSTVTPIGLEGTGEYHAATVTAVGGASANIKATAGTKEYTAAVTVYDLSTYGKMVENGDWFPGESAPYNESVYYYFYATPGRRYRVSLQNTLGTLDLEVYTDANSPSTSLVDSRRIYNGDYDEVVFTAGSLYSTYFVRVIGVMANNTFDLWTDSSASDYRFPVPFAYYSIEPNGRALYRLTGVNEDSYYRFEGVANRQYGLLVDSNSIVKITNAASQTLATRTAVAGAPVLVSFKPTTAGSVFIKLEHYGDSTLGTSLRLVMPDTETVSGENLTLMPGRLSLLPGDTRTGLQSLLASYLATTGLPSLNSALLSWGTDKSRLTITSGAITADGKYATGALSAATNQALRDAASVVVRKASTGAEDYSVVDLLGNNEVVKLVLNTPKANNIAQNGEKGYLLSTTAGAMYTLTFVPGSGSTAVTIAADPASFDIIDTFDVKSVTKTYSFISPRRFGTVYVRLRGKESTNTVTVTAAQTADTLQYPVPGSWNRLVVNAVAFNGKLGPYSLGRGLDDETALFTFDTLRPGTYIVEVTCVAGTGPVKWQVTGNLSIVPSSASLTSTGGTTRKYNLTSTAAGQRNWISVFGQGLVNKYSIRVYEQ